MENDVDVTTDVKGPYDAIRDMFNAISKALVTFARLAFEALKKAAYRAFNIIMYAVHKNEYDRLTSVLSYTKKTNARRKILRRIAYVEKRLRVYERGGTGG